MRFKDKITELLILRHKIEGYEEYEEEINNIDYAIKLAKYY